MDDLGAPISYLVLDEGVPVFDATGERVGAVEHVLAAPDEDIFDGIVLDTSILPGGHRFADSEQIAELHERGVVLSAAASELHEPDENAAALDSGADEPDESGVQRGLRRAWDYISGNY